MAARWLFDAFISACWWHQFGEIWNAKEQCHRFFFAAFFRWWIQCSLLSILNFQKCHDYPNRRSIGRVRILLLENSFPRPPGAEEPWLLMWQSCWWPHTDFFCKTWQNILTKTWKYDQFDHHFPPKNGSYQIKRGHSPFEKTNPKDLQGCSKLAAGLGTSEGQNLIGTHSSPNCPKWCWSYITTFCWALLKFF